MDRPRRQPEVLLLDLHDAVVVVDLPEYVVHALRSIACHGRNALYRIQSAIVGGKVCRPCDGEHRLSECLQLIRVVVRGVGQMLPDPLGAHLHALEADGVLAGAKALLEQLVLPGVRLVLGRRPAEDRAGNSLLLLGLLADQPALVAESVLQAGRRASEKHEARDVLLLGQQRRDHSPLGMPAHNDLAGIHVREGFDVFRHRDGIVHQVAQTGAAEVPGRAVRSSLVIADGDEPLLHEQVRQVPVDVHPASEAVSVAVQLAGAHDYHDCRPLPLLVLIRYRRAQRYDAGYDDLLLVHCHRHHPPQAPK